MMESAIENLSIHEDESPWYFIAEFSLSEVSVDPFRGAELTEGALIQSLRGMGIPPEYLKTIVRTITHSTEGASRLFHNSYPDLPVRYFLYCDRKTADNKHHSIDQMGGGWGQYVIERGRDFTKNSPQESCRIVEIYLYKEGE